MLLTRFISRFHANGFRLVLRKTRQELCTFALHVRKELFDILRALLLLCSTSNQEE